ncbi:MAG: methyltransferase [Odoribacteraceae bacterium]|jgi:tRNA1Val (adenine37-N6)-methyltransferase|nr:methyltransferase [Odoribacteraceae bacterium]
MPNSFFRFKQFTIYQERCAMKVGTDGVLLGAWADLERAASILDVGSGSGLIALMAAQRAPMAVIHAVEIDQEACGQARENIARSPWSDRVILFEGAVQQFQPACLYDVILCNPPFFVRSTPSPRPGKNIARHCETLTHEELLVVAERALAPGGTLQVILPVVEAERFSRHAVARQWYVNKTAHVLPTPGKAPKRVLLLLAREERPPVHETLIIEIERHDYHESYLNLIRAFYLNA